MKRTVFWLVAIFIFAGLSLIFSMRTYYLSQKREELTVAAVSTKKTTAPQNPNPTTVTFSEAGKIRVFFFPLLPKWPPISMELTFGGVTDKFASIAPGTSKDSSFAVTAGGSVTAKVYDKANFKFAGYGWAVPVGGKCGAGKFKPDITGFLGIVAAAGKPVVSAQCWADTDSGTDGLYYDDYFIVFATSPDASASASPSPGVSPSPSPGVSPSPSPDDSASPNPSPNNTDQASFIIHKFLDANKNGVRETGEGPTNRAWEFTYQINGGEKRSYEIDPGTETGSIVYVDKGTKIKVEELGQSGWLNTTGAAVEKTLSDNQLYYFYFGNYPVGGVGGLASPQPSGGDGFPPTQPNTGTPTWLTFGALGLGLILLVAKLKMPKQFN